MEAQAAPADLATAHRDGAGLAPEPGRDARLIAWLCAGTGLALFAVMGILGLLMRLTQADAIGISPEWFYRLMTLHGAGMLAGAMLAMMGALWFVVRASAPLSFGRMLFSYASIVLGAVAVVIAVIIGGFATGWTFLSPLPFQAAGQWSTWAAVAFLGGLALVGIGFFVFCIDVLGAVTRVHGGLGGALGLGIFRGEEPPPPQVIGAAAITTQGMLASAVGTTILFALLGRAIDSGLELDALWAKNLTYFFGHSFANLIIYLAAAMVYVLLPRYAGRPWKTTKPIVLAWLATLLLVSTAYSHHLYMDFVQPQAAQWISLVSSSAAALPVAVVTIYTGLMLVWGSRYRWTLASVLLYLGFAGWAIGGVGAVIDSLIPVNARFHNTLWVPAHFHTYLMMGVILWLMAFLASLLERAAGRTASTLATVLAPTAMVIGGYGLVSMWYASGALGVPRRYAVHSTLFPGSEDYSVAASIFVVVFAAGFLVLLVEFAGLARDGLRRRRAQAALPSAGAPRIAGAAPEALPPLQPPLTTPLQISIAVAAGVAASFVLLPDVGDASEESIQFHHLAHTAQFFLGAVIGAALASSPGIFRRFAPRWSNAALALVVVVPAAVLLLMVPDVYREFADDDALHAAYHNLVVVLGFVTGFGAALLGRVTGRLLLVLSVGMMLMYAAGVTGG
jgi:cytochrome c oxidase subunit 1